MFRRRKDATPKSAVDPLESSDGSSPLSAEACLDALAEFLRIFGAGAFELEDQSAEEIREQCEAWARHLLIGVDPPGREGSATREEGGKTIPRDLPGLRRFVDETRSQESSYVGQSLTNMLDAIWAFIVGLRHMLSFDTRTDEQVAHRLRRLESAARGDSTDRLKQEALETVDLVRECMANRGVNQQKMIQSLGARLETMRAELSVIREQAACDSLTGLFNRASLDEHLERIVHLRNLFGRKMAVFMIDIDHFKWVNDTHGHAMGDRVLREVASSLAKSFLRKEDFVARFGGEEFAVVLQEGQLEILTTLAERCLQHLRDLEFEAGEDTLRISASLGVAILHRNESPESWLERADQALYQAKNAGRDRIVIHADDDPE